MPLILHTAPSAPPVTTAEAKAHLRVDHSDEDALIDAFVLTATRDCEHRLGRALMPQKWKRTLSAFPVSIEDSEPKGAAEFVGAIALDRPVVTGVDSVSYVDSSGSTQAVADYRLAAANEFSALLLPAFGASWPTARQQPESVSIVFSCGYANAAAVPDAIKSWIKLAVGALYRNRESFAVGSVQPLPDNFVDGLLDPFRTWA